MSVNLFVDHYTGWASALPPGLTPFETLSVTEQPDGKSIPPMLRRRLNKQGRACAQTLLSLPPAFAEAATVYGSRHGDIHRTVAVLKDLSAEEPVSATDFSLAVHNAIVGILSIHQKSTASITTVASPNLLTASLIEACGLLTEGHPAVRCIIADDVLPDIYQSSDDANISYACSFVLTANPSPSSVALTLEMCDSATTTADYEALRFLSFLASTQTQFVSPQNGKTWRLNKAS